MDNNSKTYKEENHFLGSGWAFPVTFSVGNHQLILSDYEQNVNQSINTILLTHNGERILNPRFGSGLQQYFFRKMDETLKGEIEDTVKFSLMHNEPRITVKEVNVSFTDIVAGLIEIQVVYIFNNTNTRHNYVFPFYIKEGTNLKSR
ncbi:Phage tail protein [Flavobacterium sp. 9AF]|uniref:GPW/gp25 family protein n=1 Tax=Flavobacterium sp. 9AF TaxID=2653142 RepID=UPI0012F2C37C|nr:GPW/gp25 family protein [Flavobacterium sp. 9AF]VXB08506.1 Phage tail protein [Flavobacterium sp. 9AF]